MPSVEDLLAPGSKELPYCVCGVELRLFEVRSRNKDIEVRIFRCDECHHEFHLTVWRTVDRILNVSHLEERDQQEKKIGKWIPFINLNEVRFNTFANRELPRLAWLASVNWITGECFVEHGCLVETREEFFVEGVWAGSFAEGTFHRYKSFFGSGAVRNVSGEIVFVPSSATVDYLYYEETLEGIVCSKFCASPRCTQ